MMSLSATSCQPRGFMQGSTCGVCADRGESWMVCGSAKGQLYINLFREILRIHKVLCVPSDESCHLANKYSASFMMVQTGVLAAAASMLLASTVNAAIYTKNSPVLQVDSKNYDRLINQSNHTSVGHLLYIFPL